MLQLSKGQGNQTVVSAEEETIQNRCSASDHEENDETSCKDFERRHLHVLCLIGKQGDIHGHWCQNDSPSHSHVCEQVRQNVDLNIPSNSRYHELRDERREWSLAWPVLELVKKHLTRSIGVLFQFDDLVEHRDGNSFLELCPRVHDIAATISLRLQAHRHIEVFGYVHLTPKAAVIDIFIKPRRIFHGRPAESGVVSNKWRRITVRSPHCNRDRIEQIREVGEKIFGWQQQYVSFL